MLEDGPEPLPVIQRDNAGFAPAIGSVSKENYRLAAERERAATWIES